MQSTAKWLIVGGTILLVVAFFLSVFSVTSNSMSVSMRQIAGIPYLFLFYLFPIGALTALILTLVPANKRTARKLLLTGQVLGLGLSFSLFVILLAYFLFWYLSKQDPIKLGSILPAECQTGCNIWPGIGFFVLLFGFGLAVFGLLAEYYPIFRSKSKQRPNQVLTREKVSAPEPDIDFVVNVPKLQLVKGKLASQTIAISSENFSIGRSRDNHLQLADSDRKISRIHARLRFAENAWYIQDQDSKIGTFVNGKQVKAARLNSGDEIRIGEYVFNFRN